MSGQRKRKSSTNTPLGPRGTRNVQLVSVHFSTNIFFDKNFIMIEKFEDIFKDIFEDILKYL